MDHTEHWHIVGKHGENLLINEVFRKYANLNRMEYVAWHITPKSQFDF